MLCCFVLCFVLVLLNNVAGFSLDEDSCLSTEFRCDSGVCIHADYRCNDKKDCADGSDENNCDLFHCKEPHWFRCHDKECISASFRCDHSIDCLDGSDEKNCGNFTFVSFEHPVSCDADQWMCQDKMCIPLEWVCDDKPDCMDGSDETKGCSDTTHECDGFRCANGRCIVAEWICDGANDCKDNSDELNCDARPVDFMCTLEHDHFACKDNSSCIPATKVCDGTAQCKDGSDEGVACRSTLFTCANLTCSKDCLMTPAGPRCVCPKGYHNPHNDDMYLNDEHFNNNENCKDFDECADLFGICSQKCENTVGSYKCSCASKYVLAEDKRGCKTIGGEAMLLFGSKTEIRGLYLESNVLFSIAQKLRQVVGVGYDGNHIYWTDVYLESESIVRSREDGSEQEILVTAGLSAPEDLAVDWLTGNIYFTDGEMMHIGVCSNDGKHCTVLINEDIHKPRGIVLHATQGLMYWSDWGNIPQIARSNMDGSNPVSFVTENITWPNGLCIDVPNSRLYWVDAKLQSIQSVKLDGTDRRMVLQGVSKHPYGIAVFEDKIYWSDWRSYSIQSCDKFTCKNRSTLAKEGDGYIYGVHIYHSALQPKVDHLCINSPCSHLCLLRGNASYTCACPQGKELGVDKISCRDTSKKQELLIGAGNMLVTLSHQSLGRHELTGTLIKVNVHMMAFDSLSGSVVIADNTNQGIYSLSLLTNKLTILISEGIGKVAAMDFDPLGNNLYWVDSERRSVEILSMDTSTRGLVLHDLGDETPLAIALVPSEGVMFITFRSYAKTHMDRMNMDGSGRTHVMEKGLTMLGTISMVYDKGLHRVFWADEDSGVIESTSVDADDRHTFRQLQTHPASLSVLNNDVFWTLKGSRRLYWADKHNTGLGLNKKITLDITADLEYIPVLGIPGISTVPHICHDNIGGCSHICAPYTSKSSVRVCMCPPGLSMAANGATCQTVTRCNSDQFKCEISNKCLPKILVCDGTKDCDEGEDEKDCKDFKKIQNTCLPDQFRCSNGDCIYKNFQCDLHYDCRDKSDEINCEHFDHDLQCLRGEFRCADGHCVDSRVVCDHSADCVDGSDEINCDLHKCSAGMFQCQSGTCLSGSWECDGERDCIDGSDEHSGCVTVKCNKTQFTCSNNRCLDHVLRCNGNDDCGDNSDEMFCPKHSATLNSEEKKYIEAVNETACEDEQFTCYENLKICLPLSVRCNGTAECPSGEDERNCKSCQMDEFTCNNGRCISMLWTCDGTNDCGDGSDESTEHCHNGSFSGGKLPESLIPCDYGFRCKSGDCTPISTICNGEKDCYDGSDEGAACAISCSGIHCDHQCHKTPSGPQCSCLEGYKLAGNHFTCIDIDECADVVSHCSQICRNSPGSFQCGCHEGFALRSDKRSCKATGVAMTIIYSSINQIRQMSQSPPSIKVIYSESSPKITGMDLSVAKNSLYFSIEVTGQIYNQDIVTGARRYVTNIGKPSRLAVDWITENIYFVDNLHDKSLKICHLDRESCASIITFEANTQVISLAVDAINRYLFYTVTHYWVFNNPTTVIYRANLDGTHIVELLSKNVNLVTGIDADYNKKILYFCDQNRKTIESINYDGTNRQIISNNKLITKPNSLVVFEDYAYTLNFGTSEMVKCRIFGDRACTIFDLSVFDADLFIINQASRQRRQQNVCAKANCSLVCVPADLGPKCLCHGGKMVAQGQDCSYNPNDNTVGALNPEFTQVSPSDYAGQSSSSTLVAILIAVAVVFAIIGAIYLYKRTKPATGLFNISWRFQNPGFAFRSAPFKDEVVLNQQHELNPTDMIYHANREGSPVVLQKKILVNPQILEDSDSDVESDRDFFDGDYNNKTRLIS